MLHKLRIFIKTVFMAKELASGSMR